MERTRSRLLLTLTVVVLATTLLGVQASPANADGPVTFSFTGAFQQWVVPAGIISVAVDAQGAQGAGYGGKGGRIQATIPVTAGETLSIFVGGSNGFNGGGPNAGGNSLQSFANGGGASDIRQGGTALGNRKVVAGAGGGGWGCDRGSGQGVEYNENGNWRCPGDLYWNYQPTYGPDGAGGHGGGLLGQAGGGPSGNGGTQTAGGATYSPWDSPIARGTLGVGGPGAENSGSYGAGGGGGYYGGAGGQGGVYDGENGNTPAGGGGGGSSFAMSTATNLIHTAGYREGNGLVTLTGIPPDVVEGSDPDNRDAPEQVDLTSAGSQGSSFNSIGVGAVSPSACTGTSHNPHKSAHQPDRVNAESESSCGQSVPTLTVKGQLWERRWWGFDRVGFAGNGSLPLVSEISTFSNWDCHDNDFRLSSYHEAHDIDGETYSGRTQSPIVGVVC